MFYDNTNDLIDLIDLLNFTLHEDFLNKWRHKYSEKFITIFQYKLLDSLNKRKPLKTSTLNKYFTKKLKYSEDQVHNFFKSIDIGIYNPVIKIDT